MWILLHKSKQNWINCLNTFNSAIYDQCWWQMWRIDVPEIPVWIGSLKFVLYLHHMPGGGGSVCGNQITFANIMFPMHAANSVISHCMQHLTAYRKCKFLCISKVIAKLSHPASISWVALVVLSVFPHQCSDISTYLHYMRFQTIQTVYFL